MSIALIWAQARDSQGRPVIGNKGQIPWHVSEDFQHFKRLTLGHPIIMGSRTWESLPIKPLPNRTNIVLGLTTFSLAAALELAEKSNGAEEIWIIGGGSVYRQALPLANRIEVTEIDLITEGDAFAPELDPKIWAPTSETISAWQTAANGIRYRFKTYLNQHL